MFLPNPISGEFTWLFAATSPTSLPRIEEGRWYCTQMKWSWTAKLVLCIFKSQFQKIQKLGMILSHIWFSLLTPCNKRNNSERISERWLLYSKCQALTSCPAEHRGIMWLHPVNILYYKYKSKYFNLYWLTISATNTSVNGCFSISSHSTDQSKSAVFWISDYLYIILPQLT